MITIRRETTADIHAIHQLNEAAFGSPAEADLVDALRDAGALACSLVAVAQDRIVGHLAVSPVTIEQGGDMHHGTGLAPMAVLPAWQNRGVGTRLLDFYLQQVMAPGDNLLVVLGHPDFYPRFGFRPAKPLGITCEYDVPEEVFMVMEARPGALAEIQGLVRYHQAFNAV